MIFKSMIETQEKIKTKDVLINRVIFKIKGKQPGPTIVFFGGIHGNEPAGVIALKETSNNLKSLKNNIEKLELNVYLADLGHSQPENLSLPVIDKQS